MRAPIFALLAAVALVVAATAVLTGADWPAALSEDAPSGVDSFHATVLSFDGTPIVVTVFRPAGASESSPVPVVLHSHGWAGQRTTNLSGMVGRLVEAGLGVVSVDARGHGESGGFAMVHHEDYEVRDSQAVLDWIHDHLAWVRKEPASGVPKDLVAGAAGYSYGGAFQLTLASRDARLDAIAPEITWTDLADALAPQGVVKSVWVGFLYGSAKESGTRVDPRFDGWFRAAALDNALPAEALAHFEGSNPDLASLRAHVLLIQGVPDVLFNLNQAVRAYDALESSDGAEAGGATLASGAPTRDVRLFTHLTGHVLPHVQPLGTIETRRAPFQDDGPCGRVGDVVVGWLGHHLRGDPAPALAEVSFALEDGECVRLDAYPRTNVTVEVAAAPAPSAAGSILVPLAEGPLLLAGVPHLRAETAAAAPGARGHAALVVVGPDGGARVVDDQTQPFVLDAEGIDLDLAGVATRLHEGDRLFLRLDGLNEWYFAHGARLPGGALLTDLRVTLPVVEG